MVPGLAVVAVCGAVLLKLLLALPRQTAAMVLLSGVIFVAGALGMEMVGAHYFRPGVTPDWAYTICYTLEETLEMVGPAIFIRTALRYAITKQDAAAESAPHRPRPCPAVGAGEFTLTAGRRLFPLRELRVLRGAKARKDRERAALRPISWKSAPSDRR